MDLVSCIDRVLKGEREYFNGIVKHFQGPVYNTVYRMIGDKEEAKDLTQDVFLKVYKNLAAYDRQVKLSTWIYKIATNTCIDFLRKKREMLMDEVQQEGIDAKTIVFASTSKDTSPELALENKELKTLLHGQIGKLPENYKAVVVLKYVNDLTFEEIAQALDQPVNTIKTRLYRAREMLRDSLREIIVEERRDCGWTARK
ncbi:MAG: sigma-70 family RNA polymerase sigma factor [Bacillota bacterium]